MPQAGAQYSKLKQLKSQHRSICQMSFNGFTNNEIAEKTGMSPGTISCILRSPLGEAYINGMHDRVQEQTIDVRKQLIGMNKSALAAIDRILEPKNKAPFNVQLTAAKDVLDRNGYKAPDRINVDMLVHKSDEEIDKEIAAMEAAIARTQNKSFSPTIQNDNIPQEVHPFPLDESASDKIPSTEDRAPSGVSLSERRESSLAASNFLESNLRPQGATGSDIDTSTEIDTGSDSHIDVDPEFKAILSDPTFNPFNNIGL